MPEKEPSYQFSIRVPEGLLAKLDALGTDQRRSRSQQIVVILEDWFSGREAQVNPSPAHRQPA